MLKLPTASGDFPPLVGYYCTLFKIYFKKLSSLFGGDLLSASIAFSQLEQCKTG